SFFSLSRHHPDLPSFPTRRSSDLVRRRGYRQGGEALGVALWQSADMSAPHSAVSGISDLCRFCGFAHMPCACHAPKSSVVSRVRDRKSTRLNSSHLGISYAVFCLK